MKRIFGGTSLRTEPCYALLGLRVDAVGDHLSDVETQLVRGRCAVIMISSGRLGSAIRPCVNVAPVLIEEQAVDAGDWVGHAPLCRPEVNRPPSKGAVQDNRGFDAVHVRKTTHLSCQGGGIARNPNRDRCEARKS